MRFGSSKLTQPAAATAVQSRRSSGMEQFFSAFVGSEGGSILDMSGASQTNITFITELGHRISTDDFVATMEECFGKDFVEGQQAPDHAEQFLRQVLKFPDATFSGILAWDTLQFLTPPVIERVVAELFRVLSPGGLILAFFNADERATKLPVFNYRIQDQKTVAQVPRGSVQKGQFFANRTVERLFERSTSLKFFLTRDSVREVIIRA